VRRGAGTSVTRHFLWSLLDSATHDTYTPVPISPGGSSSSSSGKESKTSSSTFPSFGIASTLASDESAADRELARRVVDEKRRLRRRWKLGEQRYNAEGNRIPKSLDAFLRSMLRTQTTAAMHLSEDVKIPCCSNFHVTNTVGAFTPIPLHDQWFLLSHPSTSSTTSSSSSPSSSSTSSVPVTPSSPSFSSMSATVATPISPVLSSRSSVGTPSSPSSSSSSLTGSCLYAPNSSSLLEPRLLAAQLVALDVALLRRYLMIIIVAACNTMTSLY
jgi:hypothetical protein